MKGWPGPMTTTYWGVSRIAAQLGVATGTITKWIDRFAGTKQPFPEPDVGIAETDGRVTRGWSPTRWPEIQAWATEDRYRVRRKRKTDETGLTSYTERMLPDDAR